MPTLDDAARLAAAGLHILPIARDSKRPLGGYGLTHATDDPDTIAEWWALWPDANVAIACEASGLVVLDIDPRNGGFLENLPDDIPLDCVVVTGSGGWHVYLKAREGASYPGHLGDGIDVKWRGYVLAPPSIHPDTGKPYRYEHKGRPPLAPTTLEARAGDGITARAAQLVGSGAPIPRGQQNDVLYGFARKLWRDVGLRHLVVAALWGVVQAQCVDQDKSDPWTLEDCESIADRAVEKVDPLDVKLAAADYTVADDDVMPAPEGAIRWSSVDRVARKVAVRYGGRLNIPLGTISILTGRQGDGKGLSMVREAAMLSHEAGIIFASDEDSIAHTIRPRLEVLDARLDRIHTPSSLRLPHDIDQLVHHARQHKVRLVVVDPWTNHMGDIDINKGPELRAALMALKQAAESAQFSAVLIAHPNKNSMNPDPLERIAHSGALSQVARSAFWIVRDPRPLKDEGARLVVQVKNNLTERAATFEAAIETQQLDKPQQTVPLITFGKDCERELDWLRVHKLTRESQESRAEKAPTQTDAENWLLGVVRQAAGKHTAGDLKDMATAAGHSAGTFDRALQRMISMKQVRRDNQRAPIFPMSSA